LCGSQLIQSAHAFQTEKPLQVVQGRKCNSNSEAKDSGLIDFTPTAIHKVGYL
jgi:hypothetical protein